MIQTTVELNIVHLVWSRVTNLIVLPNRIQNFDSDIVRLPCFRQTEARRMNCLNLHILFFCSAPWLVTLWHPIVRFCHCFYDWPFEAHLCETLVTVPRHALHILHFVHILGRLLVFLLIPRRSWSSFIQGNDWFCLIDISCSAPVYSVLIARTLCWFRQW